MRDTRELTRLLAGAGIVIPFDPNSSAQRWKARWKVDEHLGAVALRKFHSRGRLPFSPGSARNLGAATQGYDPIVFVDADTVCPAEQLYEAVRLAAEAPGLVFAYTMYVRLDRNGRSEQTIPNSGSMGAVAISRDAFYELDGFDDRFIGWGYEDLDFAFRAENRFGIRRVDGPCFHVWHGDRRSDDSPVDSDPNQVELNHALYQQRDRVHA